MELKRLFAACICFIFYVKVIDSIPAKSAESICKRPNDIENGYVLSPNEIYTKNSIVSYECNFQFKLYGIIESVCLGNNTWSNQQPRCIIDYCDDVEAAEPLFGSRKGSYFIGESFEYSCEKGYELSGSAIITCLDNGNWSAPPPDCKDLCLSHKSCGVGKKCVYSEEKSSPICVCQFNSDCPALHNPVCGNNAEPYINKCVLDATACRERKDITVAAQGPCHPGYTCSIDPVGRCRGNFPIYYYDQFDLECKKKTVGGCHPSGWNGFKDKETCDSACRASTMCQQKAERGPCNLNLPRWNYDHVTDECKPFLYGGCFGSQNNFETKLDCSSACSEGMALFASINTTKLCQPCSQRVSTFCHILDELDYLIIAELKSDTLTNLITRVDTVIIDIGSKIETDEIIKIKKVSTDAECQCYTELSTSEFLLIGGKYKEGSPYYESDLSIDVFTSPHQFASCKTLDN